MRLTRLSFCCSLAYVAALFGCALYLQENPSRAAQGVVGEKGTAKQADSKKKVKLGKNIVLDKEQEQPRVLINAEVCLREGLLEQLLTRKRTKEHESVLAADIDARDLHLALILAGAEVGKPVQFRPKLVAPSGTPIKITLEYRDKDKTVRVPAQQWIRNTKTKKDFPTDWVFAGSVFIPDPLNKEKLPFYGANDGDVIAIVNFESSCIDVPFLNTKDNDDLIYQAHTERIPALKTPVTVILEPMLAKKK